MLKNSADSHSDDLESAVLELAELVRAHSSKKLEPEIQEELAKLINMFTQLQRDGDAVLVTQARIALESLLSNEPNLELSKSISKRLDTRLKARSSPLASAVRGGSAAVKVVLGLGVLMYLVLPLSVALFPFYSRYGTVLGIKIEMLGLVAFAGALGSIVSIMVRLHQFADAITKDPAILFFTGLFKPIVGTSFALFIFATLNSGLLPVTIQQDKMQYFFAALSFVAGFSERFAQDVVVKAESAIGAPRNA